MTDISWFHCSHCGSIFKAAPGVGIERSCPDCGRDPASVGPSLAGPRSPSHSPSSEGPAGPHDEGQDRGPSQAHRDKRVVRRRKNRHLTAKIMFAWIALTGLIVFAVKKVWQKDDAPTVSSVASTTTSEEDRTTLERAKPYLYQVFPSFLSVNTPEERSEFIARPAIYAGRIGLFYRLNERMSFDPSDFTLRHAEVLHAPYRRPAILTLWEGKGDTTLDAVFIKENHEWKIDWAHLERVSDMPWAVFLSGSGDDENTFRLLARLRESTDFTGRPMDPEHVTVDLYAPVLGKPGETRGGSVAIRIPRDGAIAKELLTAFAANQQAAKDALHAWLAPEGMIRLQVKITRSGADEQKKFEIKELIATHWYSLDLSENQ